MNSERTPTTGPEAPPSQHRAADPPRRLDRIERMLDEMRGHLDAQLRERRHQSFSALRLIGALVQVLVCGLLVYAAITWVSQGSDRALFASLAFAIALQLLALTAFLADERR